MLGVAKSGSSEHDAAMLQRERNRRHHVGECSSSHQFEQRFSGAVDKGLVTCVPGRSPFRMLALLEPVLFEFLAQRAAIDAKTSGSFRLIIATIVHDGLEQWALDLPEYHLVEVVGFLISQLLEVKLQCGPHSTGQRGFASFTERLFAREWLDICLCIHAAGFSIEFACLNDGPDQLVFARMRPGWLMGIRIHPLNVFFIAIRGHNLEIRNRLLIGYPQNRRAHAACPRPRAVTLCPNS